MLFTDRRKLFLPPTLSMAAHLSAQCAVSLWDDAVCLGNVFGECTMTHIPELLIHFTFPKKLHLSPFSIFHFPDAEHCVGDGDAGRDRGWLLERTV